MAVQLELFDDESTPSAVRRTKLTVISRDGESIVLWNRHYAVVSYREQDDVSKRAAAVFLIQTKLGTYPEVAALLGGSESNLYNIMREFRSKGLLGLIKQKTGPSQVKVTPEIHQYILKSDHLTYNKMVQHIQETYGVSLTISMVHYVKTGKVHQDQLQLFTDNFLQSLITDNSSKSDVSVNLSKNDVKVKEKEMTMPEEIGAQTLAAAACLSDEVNSKSVPSLETQLALSQADVNTKEVVVTTRYAGGFLLLPFLQQLDPAGVFRKAQEISGKVMEPVLAHAYGLERWMKTLLFMLWFQFSSIEDFKFVQPREFGVLLGETRAPSVKTMRRYFKSCVDEKVTDEWMLQMVRRYIQLDVIQIGTLYFDGHKIPYYGHTNLPKGYTSSRRFPMKLIEQVFANDRKGRPVFLRVHDTSLSFRDTVVGMIKDALELWNERGIRAPLVVAFDRELYDTLLFAELDALGVLYVTWRKWDTVVTLAELVESVLHPLPSIEGQLCYGPADVQYHYWRRKITVQGYIVEAISFLATEKKRIDPDRTPSTMVTNAWRFQKEAYPDYEPLTTGELIDTLCGRWGQENYFRYSKHQQQLDYMPSYETRERQEERMITNPLCKELEIERSKLRQEIVKLNQQIAKKLTGQKKKEIALEKILQQTDIQQLTVEKEENEAKSKAIKERIATLPKKVPVVPKDDDADLELVLDSKHFMDVLRIALYNAEQMLIEVFKRCYNDPRDLHALLHAIADQGGTVEERKDCMIVGLKALHIPAHKRATEKLCIELNAMKSTMAETGKRIFYAWDE
mgnify:CR=1 FL=1